jgi:SpoIID/LytB domain protein
MLPLLFAVLPAAADPSLTIQVKIFPHLFGYQPQGLEADPKHVTLESEVACNVYEGTSDHPGSTGQLLQTTTKLELSAKTLSTALWIDCPSAVQVVRSGAKENYSYLGPIYAHTTVNFLNPGQDDSNKVIELIHSIPVENYLKGVVASEMPSYWPNEALKSQAIAARTYAFFHIRFSRETGAHPFYDVDDTVFYQAFTGLNDETAQTDLAIASTSHQVVSYQGKVIQAYFSADSGGYTEDANEVWPGIAPYCQAKKEIYVDPGFDSGKWGPWTVSMPLAALNQQLIDDQLIPNANPALALSVPAELRDTSGRAKAVRLDLFDGATFDLDVNQFRRALNLRSSLFTIDLEGSQVNINGRGFGHGVGMSQYGARVLAQVNNWTSNQILHFYYTGVQICDVSKHMSDCN